MVDFHNQARTMRLADPEDRALLGSNPSAAVGDGDSDRSRPLAAPVPSCCPCPHAINPSFITSQPELNQLPNPTGLPFGNIAGARVVFMSGFYKHLAPLEPEPCLVAS